MTKQDATNQELAAFPVGAAVELGGRRARVVAVYPPDEFRDYGLVVVEAGERGLVPATTCFNVTPAGPGHRVPAGWRKTEVGSDDSEDSP